MLLFKYKTQETNCIWGQPTMLLLFFVRNCASNQLCCHQAITSSRVLYPRFSPANFMFINNFVFWRNSPTGTQTASLLRLRDHTKTHARPLGLLCTSDQPVTEAATYTTHNKHKRRTSLPSAGFEPAIPASERSQT
jgi:hypothetical protein